MISKRTRKEEVLDLMRRADEILVLDITGQEGMNALSAIFLRDAVLPKFQHQDLREAYSTLKSLVMSLSTAGRSVQSHVGMILAMADIEGINPVLPKAEVKLEKKTNADSL